MCSTCGNLIADCSNPEIDWHPRTTLCFANATTKWAWRKMNDKHKDVRESLDGLHPTEGMSIWVSTVPPPEGEDEFV